MSHRATDPTWESLPSSARRRLLDEDASFLLKQLQSDGFEILLVNGRSVLKQLQRVTNITLREMVPARETGYRSEARIFTGELYSRLRVVGWTTNLPSSVRLTNALRQRIAERMTELA